MIAGDTMLKTLLWRVALIPPLVLSVVVVTFALVNALPGDTARALLGINGTPQQYAYLRNQLGLNQPVWTQLGKWLGQVVHGNLGTSLASQQPVAATLNSRLAPTLSIVVGTVLLSALIGILLGIAAQRLGWIGRLVDMLSLGGMAVPTFWLGLILVAVFAVKLEWLPPTGYVSFAQSPTGWAQSLVLPVLTLALPASAAVTKQARDAFGQAMTADFVRTLIANGANPRSVRYRHVLRNSLNPIITVAGLNFIRALSGTIVVESVFAIPGLGGLAVQATVAHDIPVILGLALYFTILVTAANLLVDVSYAVIDPRVRLG